MRILYSVQKRSLLIFYYFLLLFHHFIFCLWVVRPSAACISRDTENTRVYLEPVSRPHTTAALPDALFCSAATKFFARPKTRLLTSSNSFTIWYQFLRSIVQRESRECTSCFLKMSSSTSVVGNDYDDGPTIFGTCLFVKKVCSTLSM